jgi:hypothetical protein
MLSVDREAPPRDALPTSTGVPARSQRIQVTLSFVLKTLSVEAGCEITACQYTIMPARWESHPVGGVWI